MTEKTNQTGSRSQAISEAAQSIQDPSTKLGRCALVSEASSTSFFAVWDYVTDIIVTAGFFKDGNWRWGFMAAVILFFASIAQVPIGLYMDATEKIAVSRGGMQKPKTFRGIVSITVSMLGLRPLVEAMRFMWLVGIKGDISKIALACSGYDLRRPCIRLGLTFSQIVESCFEAAPMLNLQTYVMIYLYMVDGTLDPLLVMSTFFSAASIGIGAGVAYSGGFQDNFEPVVITASAVLYSICQVILRLASTSMLGVKFGPAVALYFLVVMSVVTVYVFHVHDENGLQHWPFWMGTLVAIMPSYFVAIDTTDKDGPLGLNLFNCWAATTMLSPRASAMMVVRLTEGSVACLLALVVPSLPGRWAIPLGAIIGGFVMVVLTGFSYILLRWLVIRKQRRHGRKGTNSSSGEEPAIHSMNPACDFRFLFKFHLCRRCRRVSTNVTPIAKVTPNAKAKPIAKAGR